MQPATQTAPERIGLRRFAPPRALAALLVMTVAVGLTWALLVPPWQSPDETTHFAITQGLAENFKLPGVKGRPPYSSAQVFADSAVGAGRGAFFPQASPPEWSRSAYDAFRARERGPNPPSRSDGSGPIRDQQNPPLYYVYAAIPYLIAHGATTFGQLYAMRIWGVVLLLVTTLGAWLLAGEVLGRRRLSQLACAAVAALLPMNTFMSTNVNPDALLITLWTLALWLGARVINRRARTGDAVALCAVTAAAILTKATSYALVPPVLLALYLGWRRRPAADRRPALKRLGAASLALVLPVLGWLALARALGRPAVNTVSSRPFNVRQFLSYLWQFYLPRLPFMKPFRTTPQLPAYNIWLEQSTGDFGWLDVLVPHWMYPAAASLFGAIAVTAVGILARVRARGRWALLAFLALTLVALLILLHVTDYRALIGGSGQFLQGRYLLPVIGMLGLAVGLLVSRVPPRLRASLCALTVTGLLAMQVISLAAILQAYYL